MDTAGMRRNGRWKMKAHIVWRYRKQDGTVEGCGVAVSQPDAAPEGFVKSAAPRGGVDKIAYPVHTARSGRAETGGVQGRR
jgi:hypothetical protein